LPVTLTSNDPNLLLSTTQAGVGQSSIVVTVMPPNITGAFFMQALGNLGDTPTFTASAAGWGSSTATVTVAPSGVIISGPLLEPFLTASVAAGPTPFYVYTAELDSSGNVVNEEPLAAGSSSSTSITVQLSSSDTTLGAVPPSVVIPAGSGGSDTPVSANFTPVNAGSLTITAAAPSGFNTPNVVPFQLSGSLAVSVGL
jgi:hypothetical protein